MSPTRIIVLTTLAMIAFAGNSVLCRLALKHTHIDAASFTTIRLISGAIVLLLAARIGNRAGGDKGNWLFFGSCSGSPTFATLSADDFLVSTGPEDFFFSFFLTGNLPAPPSFRPGSRVPQCCIGSEAPFFERSNTGVEVGGFNQLRRD